MKTLLFTLLISLGLAATAFAAEPERLTLRIGEQKTAKDAGIKVKFVSVVEDSRCPANVNCIWAGNAKVQIRITDTKGRAPAETVVLNTNGTPQSERFYVYSVSVVGLTPQPGANGRVNKSRYRLVVNVERLSR
jgi:hypothetical protein